MKVLEGVGVVGASCLEMSVRARVHRGWRLALTSCEDGIVGLLALGIRK